MKKTIIILLLIISCFGAKAQSFGQHSIEHQFQKVGVFNPQWEIEQVLNPKKYEHLTGYFREMLAETILSAVKENRVKIYDERKREINLDTVIKSIIDFEQQHFNITLGKDSVFSYIKKYVCAYQFEEFVDYNYENVSLSKKVKAYCPYLVRYKSFSSPQIDTVQLPLFWIFPQESTDKKEIKLLEIPDTLQCLQELKYPVQMPFSTSLFSKINKDEIKVYKSDGEEFSTKKEIEKLFVMENSYIYFDEQTETEKIMKGFSDIIPEDIIALRIGEKWSINPITLEIFKKIYFYLPLYQFDEKTFTQLGIRVYNKN